MIDSFTGEYFFLSNFFDATVTYNGLSYLSSEAAFQAQKTINEDERKKFTTLNPSQSKRLGRTVVLRDDWEDIKIKVMYEVCRAKFTQNEHLAKRLLATGAKTLIEGNTWNDRFWGVCNGDGENHLGKILMKLRDELRFNATKVKNDIVNWIRDFFEHNGAGCNAVVGISGGKDSSIVAALCVEALGKDRVVGVLMPNSYIWGKAEDMDEAEALVEFLGIRSVNLNIYNIVNAFHHAVPINMSEQAIINLPPRIRMAALYAVSQSVNGRVANTCNLSEDWVGYSTRYGDSVGDFSPLSDLTVTEVKAIGHTLGLPAELVDKTPADGLCGKTDEENLGFTYEVLDKYIRTNEIDDIDTKNRIDELHNKNLFKLQLMPKFEYNG